jgi:hypothetical protein
MTFDEQDRRLSELDREFKGLLASYGAVMQSVARLDERADAGERERREMRDALGVAMREFREGLREFDKSCTAKVDEVGRKVDASAKETRQEIRDDLKQRQWGPVAKSAPYAAAIGGIAAFITALVKG